MVRVLANYRSIESPVRGSQDDSPRVGSPEEKKAKSCFERCVPSFPKSPENFFKNRLISVLTMGVSGISCAVHTVAALVCGIVGAVLFSKDAKELAKSSALRAILNLGTFFGAIRQFIYTANSEEPKRDFGGYKSKFIVVLRVANIPFSEGFSSVNIPHSFFIQPKKVKRVWAKIFFPNTSVGKEEKSSASSASSPRTVSTESVSSPASDRLKGSQ